MKVEVRDEEEYIRHIDWLGQCHYVDTDTDKKYPPDSYPCVVVSFVRTDSYTSKDYLLTEFVYPTDFVSSDGRS